MPVGNSVHFTPVFFSPKYKDTLFCDHSCKTQSICQIFNTACGGLDENGSCRLCFSIWSPAGGTVGRGLENVVLLEEVCPEVGEVVLVMVFHPGLRTVTRT